MNSNSKPEINLDVLSRTRTGYLPLSNVFSPLNRKGPPINEHAIGFPNAKNIFMAERGWRRPYSDELDLNSVKPILINKLVLLQYDDGPEFEAILVSLTNKDNNSIFEFHSVNDPSYTWKMTSKEMKSSNITIYFKTKSAYVIKHKRKSRRRQQGGFYPSVFAGVRNAGMLMPLVMRQSYRMWESSRKTRRSKSKKR